MKAYHVSFEYTETATIPNVIAANAPEAEAGAAKVIAGKVKDPRNFVASEVMEDRDDTPSGKPN